MGKLELLAPAGNPEKLKMAILYGANAVYLAGNRFGLRSGAGNFTMEEMRDGVQYAHDRDVKVYLAMNIIAHNEDIDEAASFIAEAIGTGIDAVILSDPGLLDVVRSIDADIAIHLSTQASTMNWRTAAFWQRQGVSRIILARELSLKEIRRIREEIPETLELEAFVHGAMCISHSGRCLLSNYMNGRDANRGDCSQPCRWKYSLMEEKRPGEYFPIEEDNRGSYVFNSKDLCMVDHIPELAAAGLKSLKIEGRMKSSFYVSTVVKFYREAMDAFERGEGHLVPNGWMDQVGMVSNRDFTTGFYFDKTDAESQNYGNTSYRREADFIALVVPRDHFMKNSDTMTEKENEKLSKRQKERLEKKEACIVDENAKEICSSDERILLEESKGDFWICLEQRNHFKKGETLEVLSPKEAVWSFITEDMYNGDFEKIDVAPHPQMCVWLKMTRSMVAGSILRRRNS
jgi:putative protease